MAKESVIVGLDEILNKLGPFGRYTVYNYALVIFPCFLAGLFSPAYNFEAMDINYRCEVPECEILNDTQWLEYGIPQEKGEFSKCKVYQYKNTTTDQCSLEAFDTETIQECKTYVYSEQDSVVKDFNLGCQNWKRTLIGTIHNSGYFIALPLTGLISDRYGRTVALSIASLMNGIFGIARSFSTNYNMMVILEFLESALGAGHFTTSFVMAMELVGPGGRVLGNAAINFVYVTGILILSALAWWLQNWRNLLRIVFAPTIIPVFYFIILKESPRWLISKGRYEEATSVLRSAAKMNKVEITEDMLKSITIIQENNNSRANNPDIIEEQNKNQSLIWQVVKSKIIMTRLVICSYMWMSGTFIYYGLSINSVSLAGNKYLNFMMVAFIEIPANVLVLLLLDRLGRKTIITTTFLISGCLCISLSLLSKDQIALSFVTYLAGKFFSTMAYSSIYVYVSEVFPTNVRQTLLSFCSTMGRFGTTLAPLTPLLVATEHAEAKKGRCRPCINVTNFDVACTEETVSAVSDLGVITLAFYYVNLPAIFFGTVAVIASILTRILPETIGVTLPDTIEEAEKISKKKSKKLAV